MEGRQERRHHESLEASHQKGWGNFIEVNNKKIPKLLLRIPNIVFTDTNAKGLHFLHDDVLVIQLRIANKLVKIILFDNGRLAWVGSL